MTDIENAPAKRGPGRPPMRDLQGKEDGVRTPMRRRRLHSLNDDRFAIPEEMIPEGMTLEWKTYSVTGQEQPFHIQSMRQQGWEPCQFEDFPALAPGGMKGQFVKDGMLLMQRPKELTAEFHAEIDAANKSVISHRMAALGQTPAGELPREHPSARRVSGIKQTVETPMQIEG